ncbi:MAG: guanylate kinase [Bacillota bacterium]
MTPGLLLVISGPSGVGKGTICKALQTLDPTIYLSISMTTRPPREGEVEGREYYFTSEAHFRELLTRGQLLEWARVYDFYYGTPKKAVTEAQTAGRDVLLEIDVQGGLKVKENCPESILIFVLPPSLDELSRRLAYRNTENKDQVSVRLRWAEKELHCYKQYDYAIVNDRVENAVSKIQAIIAAEKCRPRYLEDLWPVP